METITIKGKDYVPVNERIKEFWRLYPDGRILPQLISNDNGVCVFKVEVYKDKEIDTPDAIGHAYERETSSFINKTSYIENCETSAIRQSIRNPRNRDRHVSCKCRGNRYSNGESKED